MSADRVDRRGEATAPPAWPPSAWEWDLEVAATWGVPVLISAGVAASQEIARQLSRRHSPRLAVRVIDCRGSDAAAAVRSLTPGYHQGRRPEILLFQEVYALSREDQALLEGQLEEILLHPEDCSSVRILASSSVPLFDLVVQQAFQERLYYLLNMMHIQPPERPHG